MRCEIKHDQAGEVEVQDAAALEEFLRKIHAGLGKNLIEVKLFGSKATGRDQPDSDIDVLVLVERGGVDSEDQVLDIAFDVNVKHEIYISPRVIDRSILVDPVWSIAPFLKRLRKKGFLCEARARKTGVASLSRANEAFAEGEYLLTKRAFIGAVNRFCYAGFYAAM